MPFIVLEGPDGAGTTTHGQLLAEALRTQGKDVVLTAEPTGSEIGTAIRSLLSSHKAIPPSALQLLFCADRAQHIEDVILPALAAGKTVVCDRYVPSTLIYGEAAGVDRKWLEHVNAHFPKPDTTVFLLPPFEVCMQRIGSRVKKDAFEEGSFQKRVHDLYTSHTKNQPFVIDSSADRASTAAAVAAAANG